MMGMFGARASIVAAAGFAFVAGSVLAVSKGAESATGDQPLVWLATRIDEADAPEIDGSVDAVWERAEPLTVTASKTMEPHESKPVKLRALFTNDALYVLARWPDTTRSEMRDPYVWNQAKQAYERPTKPDDQFALTFPLEGDFDINMLAVQRDYIADVWHWKAGRGNPVGWVDDKRHVISSTPVPWAEELAKQGRGRYEQYALGQHAKVYIARLLDEGTSSYRLLPPPETFQGEIVDSFEPREPSGSLADIRGKGVHDGKSWTLEMTRRLDTGHEDDAVLDPAQPIPCAIAILDDRLYWHHYVSPPLTLNFEEQDR